LQVWCCVVKHGLVTLVVILIVKDTATFHILYNFSIHAWNITTVEINSGVHLLKSYIRQVPFFTPGDRVLKLLFWSWSWTTTYVTTVDLSAAALRPK